MDEVFDFREFVIKILRRFRLLFILALLFAVIAIGYKLYQVWPILTGAQPMRAEAEIKSTALIEEQKTNLKSLIFYFEQNMPSLIKKVNSDEYLFEEKLEKMQQIIESQEALTALNKELDLLEKSVIITKTSIIKSIFMYAALGLVVGLGIGLIWIFFSDIMDLRIKNSQEVDKKFKLKCLAEFYNREKSQPFARIDEWIDSLDGISLKKPTQEQSVDVLAASIQGLTDKPSQKILLTGDVSVKCLETLKSSLAERISAAEVFCAGDITLSPIGLKLAKECEEIVLVVEKQSTTYPNIENQMKCLNNIGKKILGYVAV